MERLLERIAANTDPKVSFHILLSGRTSDMKTTFKQCIKLDEDKKYEMALVSLETYYSFANIDRTNNNFKYSSDDGSTWKNIDIPEGCYEIEDINQCIRRIMKENNHYDAANDRYFIELKPNKNTLRSVLNIAENYKVDFTTRNSIRSVLGFNKKEYAAGYNESENIVDIISINSLRVTSDIIGSSYSNEEKENIVYSFFPDVGPGYKIIEVPVNLVYLPITLKTIESMETKLTDQNGKLVNLRGEELSIRFHLRQM